MKNLRRGFYRIWVALSVLWLIIVIAFSYEQIISPYIEPRVYVLPNGNSDFYKLDNPFDQFDTDFKNAHSVEVQFPNDVILFPAKEIPKAVLEAQGPSFYEHYSKPREAELNVARWKTVELSSTVAFLPPLALLLFGLVIGWIARGFKVGAPHS
jgi:hypothetical protein